MGYDITKLTDKITTLKSLADDLSTQITAKESYIEDAGVNSSYEIADSIERAIDLATSEIKLSKEKLQYLYGFGGGPTGPYPTGIYR